MPWESDPTAQVICDLVDTSTAPPSAIRRATSCARVMALYQNRGWKPVVAPEIEFYLVSKNVDPDYPLVPPIGRSGRQIQAASPIRSAASTNSTS